MEKCLDYVIAFSCTPPRVFRQVTTLVGLQLVTLLVTVAKTLGGQRETTQRQENAERIGDCDNDGRNKAYILGQNYTNEDHMTPFIHGNQLTQSTGQQRREMKGFRNRKMMGSSQDWRCNLLHPLPQNYESISTKQESREKTTLDRSSVPKLVQEIDEKLNKEKVECMICYEIVGRSAPIWSCGNCYAIFHLHCVRKWARAPSSVDLSAGQSQGSNWRCPDCQSVQLSLPDDLRYYCFCGKVQEPEVEFYLTPHSCGGPCGKPLEKEKKTPSCPHTCTLQCHPGPCPSCSAMAPPQSCPCGKTTITRRCSDHKSIESCGQCCENPLRCGRHYCDKVCHEGLCGPCQVLIKASCFCGEKEEMILCGDMEIQGEIDWKNGVFACKNLCMKILSCQNHKCSKICHPGEYGECELSPGKVKSCPCGKTQLQNQRIVLGDDKVLSYNSDLLQLRKAYENGFLDMKIKIEYPNARELKSHLSSGSIVKSLLTINSKGRLGDKVTIFDVKQLIGQPTVTPVTADKTNEFPVQHD